MYTSVVDLSLLSNDFETVLRLKEIKTNNLAVDQINKRKWDKKAVGFVIGAQKTDHPILKPRRITMFDLLRAVDLGSILECLIFGPAYVLLPSQADVERQSENANFDFELSVRNGHARFTTDSHSTANDGKQVSEEDRDMEEAIHVWYTGSAPALA